MALPPPMQLVGKVATEFIGTMILAMTVSLTAKASLLAPLAIGFVLMVLVYLGGHVSGGHYNPAVTLSILIRGGDVLDPLLAMLYIPMQVGGALIGALLSWAMIGKDKSGYPAIATGSSAGAAFLGETVITFALCLVVLLTATSKAQANNSYYGLAIGSTVLSGAISVGSISGGAFNPAVGMMSLLYDNAREDVWCYWAGPLLGAILAGAFFRLVCPDEYKEDPVSSMMELVTAGCMEFAGTLMLCFTVAMAAASTNTSKLIPLAIGSMLMVMVYAGGSVSGGHYNPAVTLGVLLRTGFSATHDLFGPMHAVVYFFSQVMGALLATYVAWGVLEGNKTMGFPVVPKIDGKIGKGFAGELLGTFLLVYVVLNVATCKQLHGNSFFGLAIGQTVTCMAIVIGPFTGGAFNPAVGLIGPFSGGQKPGVDLNQVWIYWVACPIGAVLAAAFFRMQNYEEFSTSLASQKFMAHVPADADGDNFMKHASKRGKAVKDAAPQMDGPAAI